MRPQQAQWTGTPILILTCLSIALISCSKGSQEIDQTSDLIVFSNRSNSEKIKVCHYDHSIGTWQLIEISENAVSAHLAHGDVRLDDQDNDGFVPDNECDFGQMGDCDDLEPEIFPGQEEDCTNGSDDDCDGQVDDEDSDCSGIGVVTDFEGNEYRTVRIGSQWWMAENLRSTVYNDGIPIPYVPEPSDPEGWQGLITPAYTWYENDPISYPETYGALYNYYVVSDTNRHNVCPVGWHVPSDDEWTVLIAYLDPSGIDPNVVGIQSTVAGGKMKEQGTDHWTDPNVGASNESNFTGLGGGLRSPDGSFLFLGIVGAWWSETATSSSGVAIRNLNNSNTYAVRGITGKQDGLSVRCVKD